MALPGGNYDGVWLREQGVCKLKSSLERSGRREDAAVSGDTHEAAHDDFGQAERLIRRCRRRQPVAVALVIGRRFAKRIDEDVDVQEDQASAPSIKSTNADVSSRSTPG